MEFPFSSRRRIPSLTLVLLVFILIFAIQTKRRKMANKSSRSDGITPPLSLSLSGASRRHDILKIQVASDLHIEFYREFSRIPEDIIVPNAPILALVGDIGLAKTDILKQFLYYQTQRFEHVLYLAGNHEFYNPRQGRTQHTVSEQMEWLREICQEKSNLHFLERSVVDIQGVVILGTTLWSHVPTSKASLAERSMNDYHLSFVEKDKTMGVEDTNREFDMDILWLQRHIEYITKEHGKKRPIVVLTHHTPSMEGTSNPVYDHSDLSVCFSTDLVRLLQPPIKAWVSGHTHWNFDISFPSTKDGDDDNEEETTRLVSNQRGYPAKKCMDYDNEGVILTIPIPVP